MKNKSYLLKLAKLLKTNDKVQEVTDYADSNVDVRISHPPRFPETPLTDYIQLNHGQIIKTFRQKDCYNLETGVRIFKLEQKGLENNPIPSFLSFRKYKFPVKCEGQNKLVASVLKWVTMNRTAKENINLNSSKSKANVELHQKLQQGKWGPNGTTYEDKRIKRNCKMIESSSCGQLETNNEQSVQRLTSKSQPSERQYCGFCNKTGHNEKD